MKILPITSLVLFSLVGCAQKEASSSATRMPKDGYVSDERTAIAVAVAVWTPVFGERQIADEKPYRAVLKDGVWHVFGYLPPNRLGGVAEAQIAKKDGKILSISHGQ
jgi:hypothetical protein